MNHEQDPLTMAALSDARLEDVLIRQVPETKLWVNMTVIDDKYKGQFRNPNDVELALYDLCLREVQRRGAKAEQYAHNYRMYCGARKCERL